jgi:hypothetical protein
LNRQREREKQARLQAKPVGDDTPDEKIIGMLPVDDETRSKIRSKLRDAGCIDSGARISKRPARMIAQASGVHEMLSLAEPWRGPLG